MATAETNLVGQIMLALSEAGCLVFRNNTGCLPDVNGRAVKFGLCNGGSDIIGIAKGGAFLAVEVKTPTGRVTPDQARFIAVVKARGGRAGVARSVAEALLIAAGQTV